MQSICILPGRPPDRLHIHGKLSFLKFQQTLQHGSVEAGLEYGSKVVRRTVKIDILPDKTGIHRRQFPFLPAQISNDDNHERSIVRHFTATGIDLLEYIFLRIVKIGAVRHDHIERKLLPVQCGGRGPAAIRPIDPGRLVVDKNALAAAQQQFFADYRDGTIPFFFGPQLQSERYYYTLLTFSQPTPVRKSLFYDRTTGESRLFAKTKEGLALDLKYMTDDYAVGLVDFSDREALKELVSREEALLLDRMREGDNPWTVKYMFK